MDVFHRSREKTSKKTNRPRQRITIGKVYPVRLNGIKIILNDLTVNIAAFQVIRLEAIIR